MLNLASDLTETRRKIWLSTRLIFVCFSEINKQSQQPEGDLLRSARRTEPISLYHIVVSRALAQRRNLIETRTAAAAVCGPSWMSSAFCFSARPVAQADILSGESPCINPANHAQTVGDGPMDRSPTVLGNARFQSRSSRDTGRGKDLCGRKDYLILLLTSPNTLPKLVPTVVTAPMIATAINEPMRPYSMAVAPDSSRRSFINTTFMTNSPSCNKQASSPFSPPNRSHSKASHI
jgi:hypothetical protein